jgi:outer membrane receptor protein involved in Fe transport
MIRKSAWLISAGLSIIATPALAQTAQSTTDTDKQTAQPTPGASEGAAVEDQARQQQPVDTGDIIVTATRRNQALSDVPLAVSAVTAQNLQNTGATDIRQLNQVAPSLLVSSTTSESGAAVARIRGIGTVGDNPGLEGSVGLFVDGVYRSRTGIGLTDLGPLDRIEVLRGPQGTLFGRNTSAGLISVITAKPRFQPEVSGQIDVGNYDYIRVQTSATGPITDTIAARLDTVFAKRDGFLKDVISGRDVNDRNRGMLRGQLLFQPSDAFSFRLIADYSRLREECCAASYLPAEDVVSNGSGGVTTAPSSIAAIERALGGVIEDDTFRRKVSITPGRDYDSDVNDGGISGEAVYDMGWAELTSITAYRYNKYTRGQDADFNNLDILYRDSGGGSFNRFKTFTQELRLQGNAFNNHLDWLVGGYYANEKLKVVDNLAYGADYQRFTDCVLFASVLPQGLNPAAPGCVSQPVITGGLAQLQAGIAQVQAGIAALQAAIANPLTPPAQIPALQAQLAALQTQLAELTAQAGALGALNANPANPGFGSLAAVVGLPGFDQGAVMLNDTWNQRSNNWALFTHNIISLTDRLKLTVGARYTHEQKKLAGDLNDNNTLCVNIASSPLAAFQQLPCVIPGIPGGHLDLADKRTENKVSGTVVLSYKPTDRLLTYASYSRGYKAGGFNLDRSALFRTNTTANGLSGSGAVCISPTQPNCQGMVASGADLQFKPEINDAFEIGAKYKGRGFDINLTVFHQLLRDFQLNTFNGLNFVVENINSCSDSLGGADTDNDPTTGACTGKTRAGVKNTGFELEAFTRPMRDLAVNGGVTMANTKYRDNLVGADGKPLTNALFQLPGRQISNAPKWTITGSVAWTPPIGSSGLRALLYADIRHMSHFNTGSDLDIEKTQGSFSVVNARAGIHGPDNVWGIEVWAQNVFDKNYIQVGFDAPIQGSGTTRGVQAGFYPRSTQLYGAFLGEPRTFGVTLRGKLGFHRPAPPAYVPPPPPPPPPPATQTCPDGAVILATDTCPAPPPPPPPPAPAPERG